MSKNRNISKTINHRVDAAKDALKNANKTVFNTTEEVVDYSIKRGEEWQNVTEKALKGGLKLASNQQDIIFDTLFSVKGQLQYSRKRLSALFSKN